MILDVRPVYAGRVIQLSIERVQLPNGSVAELEIVRHPGGAAIVALDDRQHVCLLRQFRHAADGSIVLERAVAAPPQDPDRFAKLRGIAGPGPSTDEIMAMTRGD